MALAVNVFTAAVLLLLPCLAAGDWSGWTEGRASYYGQDGGATIDQGSCMFGHLDWNVGTGWDIVALSDNDPEYSGSCGRCYEVACRNAVFKDGYGQSLDRSRTCFDESKSVIVRVTDSCPCYYPGNAYSNKRWCCGDMRHLDLSYWAYQKLGNLNDGVMGVRFRRVDCPNYSTGTQSAQPAGSWGSSSGSSASSWASSSSSGDGSSASSWASSSSSSSSSSASASSGSWFGNQPPFAAFPSGGAWSHDWPNRTGRKMMGEPAAAAAAAGAPAPAPAQQDEARDV